jgi:hypothetical protein
MKHVIITGMGRSGTTFVGKFLERYNTPERFAGHEILVYNHNLDAWKEYKAGTFDRDEFWTSYWKVMRAKTNANHVIDVDSFLRFFIPAPDARIGLLVRNPIDVIASFFAMSGFEVEPIALEKMCDEWVVANQYVSRHADAVFQFERLISYGPAMFLNFVGISPNSEIQKEWMEAIKIRVNATKPERLVKGWREWPEQCKTMLLDICGPTMKEVGYWTS